MVVQSLHTRLSSEIPESPWCNGMVGLQSPSFQLHPTTPRQAVGLYFEQDDGEKIQNCVHIMASTGARGMENFLPCPHTSPSTTTSNLPKPQHSVTHWCSHFFFLLALQSFFLSSTSQSKQCFFSFLAAGTMAPADRRVVASLLSFHQLAKETRLNSGEWDPVVTDELHSLQLLLFLLLL